MIGKLVKGRGFRGALNYDLSKEGGKILDTNMAGETPRQLATEFGEIRKLRPSLEKAVLHVSISAAPGEKLTDEQWRVIGQRYLKGMGLDQNQYVITKHNDTEHQHIHILVNRIRFDGSVTSDSQDFKRQEAIMRELEEEFGLQRVAPSQQAERKAPTKGEIEGGIRTGQPSARQQLQELCDAAAKDCESFTTYAERLEAAGVELVPVAQLGGAKLSGLSYRLDGVTMKGSDLGKAYSPSGLEKRGIKYGQDRDFAAVRRSIERESARALGKPDRNSAAIKSERGRPGGSAGAVGPSNGSAGRENSGHIETQPANDGPANATNSSVDSTVKQPAGATTGVVSRGSPRNDGGIVGDAHARVTALAGIKGKGYQQTAQAVREQLSALGGEQFEIGILDQHTGKMQNRSMTRADIEKSLGWLRMKNAQGCNIYIRPPEGSGIVMVDDLNNDQVSKMEEDGLPPAAVVETSPANFQCWVRFSEGTIEPEVRKHLAREVAKKYGGDPASADANHYGRLAGFTNQKQKHRNAKGQQPYCRNHKRHGSVGAAVAALAAQMLLAAIQAMRALAANNQAADAAKVLLDRIKITPKFGHTASPEAEYRQQARNLLEKYGDGTDFSRMDFMIAKSMLGKGYSVAAVEKAMLEASPSLALRKAGHAPDYVQRTVKNAQAAISTPTPKPTEREEIYMPTPK